MINNIHHRLRFHVSFIKSINRTKIYWFFSSNISINLSLFCLSTNLSYKVYFWMFQSSWYGFRISNKLETKITKKYDSASHVAKMKINEDGEQQAWREKMNWNCFRMMMMMMMMMMMTMMMMANNKMELESTDEKKHHLNENIICKLI